MIKHAKQYAESNIYEMLDEDVAMWFRHRYRKFTPPQRYAIPYIINRKNILISSPTGSGKTLSAFLGIINELVVMSKKQTLEDRIYAVYVSPLRALNNDMEKNLNSILDDLNKYIPHTISIGIWTSDTTQYRKTKLKRKPPHILITTPESLLLMQSSQMLENLKKLDWVVIDEIHALADNKRGTSLALSLARLGYYGEFARIGLSATVAPLEEVAKYLVGEGRECYIADVSYSKQYDIKVETVADDFMEEYEILEMKLKDRLKHLIANEKSTLIFTNTRSRAEELGYYIEKTMGEQGQIRIHHSSLSRNERLNVEKLMKEGKLKAIFSSASLELGIDIGDISLVILIDSPKSAARALQRIGRAGHNLSQVSRGIFITRDIDTFIEDLIINKNIYEKKYDTIQIPKNSLDVLAQHIISVSYLENHTVDDLYKIIKTSYSYSTLEYQDYLDLINLLANGYMDIVKSKIRIEDGKILLAYPKSLFMQNAGTISEEVKIPVYQQDGYLVGYLDERYARMIHVGDVFVLGGKNYRMIGVHENGVIVNLETEKPPNIPSWYSEVLPLSYETALDIELFRGLAEHMNIDEISEYLGVNRKYASQIKDYIMYQKMYSGVIPDDKDILIEHWYENKIDKLIHGYAFHYVAGRRANEAMSKLYMDYIHKNITDQILVMVSDYGFVIYLPENADIYKDDVENILEMDKNSFIESIRRIIHGTQRYSLKFKDVLIRMFALKTGNVSIMNIANRIKDMIGYDLKNVYVKEAYNEIMNNDLRIEQAWDYQQRLKKRTMHVVNLPAPSPFAANIMSSNLTDRIEAIDKRAHLIRIINMLKNEGRLES